MTEIRIGERALIMSVRGEIKKDNGDGEEAGGIPIRGKSSDSGG